MQFLTGQLSLLNRLRQIPRARTLQLLCLATAAFICCFFMFASTSFCGLPYIFAHYYMILPTLLFFGLSLGVPHPWPLKGTWLLCLSPVVWFLISETLLFLDGKGSQYISIYFTSYLLAFPFAALAGEGHRRTGLHLVGGFYLFFTLFRSLRTLLCFSNFFPGFSLTDLIWDGSRLSFLTHPNIAAGTLLVGIGLSLYFFSQAARPLPRVLWFLSLLAHLFTLALTNSRTSILLAGGMLAGALFVSQLGRGWKRLGLSAVIGVLLLLLIFQLSGSLYRWNEDRLIQLYLDQAAQSTESTQENSPLIIDPNTGEVSLKTLTTSGQGSLSQNFFTFNGRTYIWEAALRAVAQDPALALRGTDNVAEVLSQAYGSSLPHAHNSWFQVLLRRGIPGLVIALIYTFLTLRNALVILFRPDTDFSLKTIALLCLGILGISFLEPYLFTADINYFFVEFFFFLSAGYLHLWYHLGRGTSEVSH